MGLGSSVVEQRTENPRVVSSILTPGTKKLAEVGEFFVRIARLEMKSRTCFPYPLLMKIQFFLLKG